MPVGGVTSANAIASAQAPAGKRPDDLGKDDFLKLLMVQLTNQDPLKPMEDREFIAQLAQFRSLEAMQELDRHMSALVDMQKLTQAAVLIGREAVAKTGADGPTITGRITAAAIVNGVPQVTVNGQSVKVSDVISISEGGSTSVARAPVAANAADGGWFDDNSGG